MNKNEESGKMSYSNLKRLAENFTTLRFMEFDSTGKFLCSKLGNEFFEYRNDIKEPYKVWEQNTPTQAYVISGHNTGERCLDPLGDSIKCSNIEEVVDGVISLISNSFGGFIFERLPSVPALRVQVCEGRVSRISLSRGNSTAYSDSKIITLPTLFVKFILEEIYSEDFSFLKESGEDRFIGEIYISPMFKEFYKTSYVITNVSETQEKEKEDISFLNPHLFEDYQPINLESDFINLLGLNNFCYLLYRFISRFSPTPDILPSRFEWNFNYVDKKGMSGCLPYNFNIGRKMSTIFFQKDNFNGEDLESPYLRYYPKEREEKFFEISFEDKYDVDSILNQLGPEDEEEEALFESESFKIFMDYEFSKLESAVSKLQKLVDKVSVVWTYNREYETIEVIKIVHKSTV